MSMQYILYVDILPPPSDQHLQSTSIHSTQSNEYTSTNCTQTQTLKHSLARHNCASELSPANFSRQSKFKRRKKVVHTVHHRPNSTRFAFPRRSLRPLVDRWSRPKPHSRTHSVELLRAREIDSNNFFLRRSLSLSLSLSSFFSLFSSISFLIFQFTKVFYGLPCTTIAPSKVVTTPKLNAIFSRVITFSTRPENTCNLCVCDSSSEILSKTANRVWT